MSVDYERFTDRARKAMQLANQESQRWNLDDIVPGCILIGIVKANGMACKIFKTLGIDPDKFMKQVRDVLVPGPDMITMGRLPLSPLAEEVIHGAIAEAKILNHDYVGTEHIVGALLQIGFENSVCRILRTLRGGYRSDRLLIDDWRKAILAMCNSPETEIVPHAMSIQEIVGDKVNIQVPEDNMQTELAELRKRMEKQELEIAHFHNLFDLNLELANRVEELERLTQPVEIQTVVWNATMTSIVSSGWSTGDGLTPKESLLKAAKLINEMTNSAIPAKDIPQSVIDGVAEELRNPVPMKPDQVIHAFMTSRPAKTLPNGPGGPSVSIINGVIQPECTCDVLRWDDASDKMRHELGCPLAKGGE